MRKPLILVTFTLIALNALIYFATMKDPSLLTQYGLIPALVPTEPVRMFTSMFLHANLTHLFFNMFVLWSLGASLEGRLGPVRFLLLYALGGLGGSLLVWLAAPPQTTTVGASGAIFALFGALLIFAKDQPESLRSVVMVVVFNLIFTFTSPNVSWQGHIGGLVTGLALGVALYSLERSKPKKIAQPKGSQAPERYNGSNDQWSR